jgi:hypothetical protein
MRAGNLGDKIMLTVNRILVLVAIAVSSSSAFAMGRGLPKTVSHPTCITAVDFSTNNTESAPSLDKIKKAIEGKGYKVVWLDSIDSPAKDKSMNDAAGPAGIYLSLDFESTPTTSSGSGEIICNTNDGCNSNGGVEINFGGCSLNSIMGVIPRKYRPFTRTRSSRISCQMIPSVV